MEEVNDLVTFANIFITRAQTYVSYVRVKRTNGQTDRLTDEQTDGQASQGNVWLNSNLKERKCARSTGR